MVHGINQVVLGASISPYLTKYTKKVLKIITAFKLNIHPNITNFLEPVGPLNIILMSLLCIKMHYELKIKIFCLICISFGFVLKTMLNHKRIYLRFVAEQLRVCDCDQLQHSKCILKLERSVEYLGFIHAALENF